MQSKEEIEKDNNYWKGYIQKQNEAMEICKQCKYMKKAKELETEKQKLIKDLEGAIDFTKTGRDLISKAKVECLENVLKILKGENDE